MKNIYKLYAVIIAGLLILSGCRNSFILLSSYSPNNTEPMEGKGTFCLELGAVHIERTILPATVQSDFAVYTLVFSAIGRDDVTADRTFSALGDPVVLSEGTWDLTVTAYMDGGKTMPAAQGYLEGIVINAGISVSGSLELDASIETGANGVFCWDIDFPADVTTAAMTITPLNAATGTPAQTLYFKGGTPLVSKDNSTSLLVMKTGYYQVVFSLSNGNHDTGMEEYLHIYKNMESRFAYTFTQEHFTVYSVTSGEDSGPGSLRHAITNAAGGSTIFIENGVNTIKLKSRLEIARNLSIKGNGATFMRDAAWTATDNNSQLLFVNGSGTTVTINRVHFKDGRAANNGAAINNGGNLTLESCIVSGGQTNGASASGGAVYNGGVMNVKGCTFYGNSGYRGGVIYNNGTSAALTLQGSLFYGNTASNAGPIVYRNSGTVTSGGYNAVDVALGTGTGQSGWSGAATDKLISIIPVYPVNFRLLSGSGAAGVITSLPAGYPSVDFYGDAIIQPAAAGAVQSTAAGAGYYLNLSVNDGTMGSAGVSPLPDMYGLISGSITITAAPGVNCEFSYWLINGSNAGTVNPLNYTITANTVIQAVFNRTAAGLEYVNKVTFTGSTATVNFSGLTGNDIYLVKINKSNSAVTAANTGRVPDLMPDIQYNEIWPLSDEIMPRMGHPAADKLSANPPPITIEPFSMERDAALPAVGDTKQFWVETYYDSNSFVQKPATLMASGTYGNIWVMNENINSTNSSNKVTTAIAQAAAAKFDIIYPAETNLLGYEFGGGPGGNGGRDGDPKIQILIYNIVNSSGSVMAAGYFWAKDYYTQTGSNQAEIFYIDASQLVNVPDYIYSTLVHEFQHMINFNEKTIKRGLSSDSWYNEMLSMMTEDLMANLIGIPLTSSLHKIQQRLPYFLRYYYEVGITEWTTLGTSSYAKGIAFGAYLTRNYGGAELIKNMLSNNAVNVNSITAALNQFSPGLDFDQALSRFSEAMIFSGAQRPAGVLSFDNTVTKSISGYTYTAFAFNIWNMNRTGGGQGPYAFDLNPIDLRPRSLSVHTTNDWKNKTGNYSITLERPSNANIELYLMVK